MPNKKEEQRLYGPAKTVPETRSWEEREKDFRESLRILQRLEKDDEGKSLVSRDVYNYEPQQIIIASDWHIGSISSDLDAMYYMRDYILAHDNVGVIFAGDEVEGMVAKYLSTNAARTPYDFQKQIDFLHNAFLKPLADRRKVLGMVSGYWGHPGWAADASTLNTWRIMVGDLDIPIITNGGELEIVFPNKSSHRIKVWHNPPGSSKYDEVKGLREALQGMSETHRPKGAVNGHIHRMGVSQEYYAGASSQVYLISAGTMKGSNPDLPRDTFGERLGASLPHPQGQGVIVRPQMGRRAEQAYPFASLRHGEIKMKALSYLDRVESLGIKDEILEKISKKVEEYPEVRYEKAWSRLGGNHAEERPIEKVVVGGETIRNEYSHMEMRTPYDALSYDIKTKLPIALHLIQNVRIGSSSEGIKDLDLYVNRVAQDPHSLFVFLRNMIDKESGKSPDRMEILQRFTDLVDGVKDQTLAVMLDESLRDPWWKKKVKTNEVEYYEDAKGNWREKPVYSMPIAPASYVANQTDVPLIHHLSLIKLSIGPSGVRLKEKPLYTGAFADKLEGYGSQSKPTWGLQRLYDLQMQLKPGYMTGGHMGNTGTATIYDGTNDETNYPLLIAPGWWASSADTGGKGNVKPGAEGGQAVIFLPGKNKNDYTAIPTADVSETENMKDATTLLIGLQEMEKTTPGITKRVLGKR